MAPRPDRRPDASRARRCTRWPRCGSRLCISALNTPPETASAQMFANVLARRVQRQAPVTAISWCPRVDLSALLPGRRGAPTSRATAARFATGHRRARRRCAAAMASCSTSRAARPRPSMRRSSRSARISSRRRSVAARRSTTRGASALAQVAALAYESITTIYLGYATPIALPAPILAPRRCARPVGVRSQRAVGAAPPAGVARRSSPSSSARAARTTRSTRRRSPREADAQLRRLAGEWPLPVWSRVIVERRATYACTAGAVRPAAGTTRAGPLSRRRLHRSRVARDARSGDAQRRRGGARAAGRSPQRDRAPCHARRALALWPRRAAAASLLAQHELLDLAGRGLRQRPEHDALRHLEVREMLAAPGDDVGLASPRPRRASA